MFWSPLRTAALRTGPAFPLCPFVGAQGGRGSIGSSPFQRRCCFTASLLPEATLGSVVWLLRELSLPETTDCPSTFSARASFVNLSCQHTSPSAPVATPIHMAAQPQQAGGDREHITVQPTEALKPCICLPFQHVLWFSQVEIFLHPGKAFKSSCCVFSKAL